MRFPPAPVPGFPEGCPENFGRIGEEEAPEPLLAICQFAGRMTFSKYMARNASLLE